MKKLFISILIFLSLMTSFSYASSSSTYIQDLSTSFRSTQDYVQYSLLHWLDLGVLQGDILNYISMSYVPYATTFNPSANTMIINFYYPLNVNATNNDEFQVYVNYGEWGTTPGFQVNNVARFYLNYIDGSILSQNLSPSDTSIIPVDYINYYNIAYSNYLVYGYKDSAFIANVVNSQTNSINNTINNSSNNMTNQLSNSINTSTTSITNTITSETDRVLSTDTSNLTDINIPPYTVNFAGFNEALDGITTLVSSSLFDYNYNTDYIYNFDLGFLGNLHLQSSRVWFLSHHWVYQLILNGLCGLIVFRFIINIKHNIETGNISNLDSDINITDAL